MHAFKVQTDRNDHLPQDHLLPKIDQRRGVKGPWIYFIILLPTLFQTRLKILWFGSVAGEQASPCEQFSRLYRVKFSKKCDGVWSFSKKDEQVFGLGGSHGVTLLFCDKILKICVKI
jgi:hypothetical protein